MSKRWIDNKVKPMPEKELVVVRVVKGKGTEDRLAIKVGKEHTVVNVSKEGKVTTTVAKKLKVLYWLQDTFKTPE